jgi:hypothetical protein
MIDVASRGEELLELIIAAWHRCVVMLRCGLGLDAFSVIKPCY